MRAREAERANDGVPAFERLTQDDLVARVSDDPFRSLKTARLFGGPRQHGYVVVLRQRLADDQVTGAAGRAKDQYLRLSRPDGIGCGILHGSCLGKRDAPKGSPVGCVSVMIGARQAEATVSEAKSR